MMTSLNISSSSPSPRRGSADDVPPRTNDTPPAKPSRHDMHASAPNASDTAWVYNLQAVAVLIIVLGQVLDGLQATGALPFSEAALWLRDCLMPLQLPVLFFCLGYLYQRFRQVRTGRAWLLSMKREACVLLAPFAAFTVLSLAANSAAGLQPALTAPQLLDALVLHPVAPLGYLYTAFLLLAITPTVKSRRNAYGLLLAAALAKVAVATLLTAPGTADLAASAPYALITMAENWVWFAGGMALALLRGLPLMRSREKAWALGALWIAASVITFMAGWIGEVSHAILDAIGILWFASLFATVFRRGHQDGFFNFITAYTMAFFLMSGPLITAFRALLAGLGLAGGTAPVLYAIVFLGAGFGAPLALQYALERAGRLDAIVYPGRFLPPLADILRNPTAPRRPPRNRLTLY